ncbi:MAG: rhodanese-like domain-containing protein [Flavobacteriales bacterium]
MSLSCCQANKRSEIKAVAVIVDARIPAEYKTGHIRGSINLPLQTLSSQLNKIKKDKPVITCCASGMRSASAKSILRGAGFENVHNGGGWSSLQHKV